MLNVVAPWQEVMTKTNNLIAIFKTCRGNSMVQKHLISLQCHRTPKRIMANLNKVGPLQQKVSKMSALITLV
jgi:hypothetical protein